MADRTLFDATAHLQALDSKRISAVELLDAAVSRYHTVNPKINAVVVTDLERARARAAVIDELRMKGESPGPLAGLPMTIKDCLDVDGMPASCGLAALLKRPGHDAAAVAKARQAGAVIWGKTNVPVMVGDWQSYNDVYGTTNNPWDLSRGPGGSSGGAAAAWSASTASASSPRTRSSPSPIPPATAACSPGARWPPPSGSRISRQASTTWSTCWVSATGRDRASDYRPPVEPNPPAPRSVSSRLPASCQLARVTGAMTIWAMRSPRRTVTLS